MFGREKFFYEILKRIRGISVNLKAALIAVTLVLFVVSNLALLATVDEYEKLISEINAVQRNSSENDVILLYAYNFKTQRMEIVDAANASSNKISEFIPQDAKSQTMYKKYIRQGLHPLEAARKVSKEIMNEISKEKKDFNIENNQSIDSGDGISF